MTKNLLVVGAHSADVGGNLDQGAVYVFDWYPGGGQASSQVTKLVASDGATDDHFGASLSVSGNTILAGAVSATVAEKGHQGAAYVFDRNLGGSDGWRQVARLTASDGEEGDYFGRVALSGDTALVGASYARVGWNVEQGAAYIYYRNQGGANACGEVVKLLAADGSEEDYFGSSVSLDGDIAVIGAVGADGDEKSDEGAAYTFGRNLGGPAAWGQLAKITADDATEHDWFGVHAAVSGDTILVGAPVARVSGRECQGAAYVFGPPGPRYVLYVPLTARTPASP